MARTEANVETDDVAVAESLDPTILPVGPDDDGEDIDERESTGSDE